MDLRRQQQGQSLRPGLRLRHWRQRPAVLRRELARQERLGGLWLRRALWRLALVQERLRAQRLARELGLEQPLGKVVPPSPHLPPSREVPLLLPTRQVLPEAKRLRDTLRSWNPWVWGVLLLLALWAAPTVLQLRKAVSLPLKVVQPPQRKERPEARQVEQELLRKAERQVCKLLRLPGCKGAWRTVGG